MHPTILYEITKARTAEMRRQATRDAIARAARRGHRAHVPQRRHLAASLARRVATVRAARGRPAPARPCCQLPEPCHACT
jgi:hypothetical protein